MFRSNRSHMFFKIGVLKNFAIFTEKKKPCGSLILINLQLQKLGHRCFAKFRRTPQGDFFCVYSELLVMADNICSEWKTHGQTFLEKALFTGQLMV